MDKTEIARALAAMRVNPGRKAGAGNAAVTHKPDCSPETPCDLCRRRAYRRTRYERTGKR